MFAKFPRACRARRRRSHCRGCERGPLDWAMAATVSRHPRFVKRSRCFSHCAVVIGVQCMSIRDCTVPKSPSLWLGGQYGEESQIEDEVRGEENCEEDQAQDHAQKGEVASAAATRTASSWAG